MKRMLNASISLRVLIKNSMTSRQGVIGEEGLVKEEMFVKKY